MKNISFRVLAFSAMLTGILACNKDVGQPPLPELSTTMTSLDIPSTGETTEMSVWTNRSFSIDCDESWLAFDPAYVEIEAGEVAEYKISVTALPTNVGDVRTGTFVIKTRTHHVDVSVTQAGDPAKMPVNIYTNDFDAEQGTSSYPWYFLDNFTGWRNENGSGVTDALTYYGAGVSIRANSTSNSRYSAYDGSGSNNLFFGSSANFAVGNIALHQDHRGIIMTFGSEKYLNSGDSVFDPEEFPVMISNDGTNWVEVSYTFQSGGWPEGTWELATANFTLPEQTAALWVRFAPSVASAYRLDDLKLTASPDPVGETIDWSAGTSIELGEPVGSTTAGE